MKYRLLFYGLIFFSCQQVNNKEVDTTEVQVRQDSSVLGNKQTNSNVLTEVLDTNIYGVKKETKLKNIKSIITCFKNMDVEGISKLVTYPLERDFPIPPINNALEFQNRFHQVFDSYLIDPITNSSFEDWHEDDFGIWLFFVRKDNVWDRIVRLSHNGLICEIRHLSKEEKKYREELITKEKMTLHPLLREYEVPLIKIKTKDYLIRIDCLKKDKYRYASWKLGERESSKPDLIISGGELIRSNGGSSTFFRNKEFTYEVAHHFIGGKDSPEYSLEVKKGEELILIQAGVSNHNNSFEYVEQIEKDLKSLLEDYGLSKEELLNKLDVFKINGKDEMSKELKRIMNRYDESVNGLNYITEKINKKYYWDY